MLDMERGAGKSCSLNLFFSKSHGMYRQDDKGQAGDSLGEEGICDNEVLSVFVTPSSSVFSLLGN